MCEIINTVKVSFGDGVAKPDMSEIVNFVKGLDTNVGEIEAVYRIAEEKSIFMKFKSEEAMLHTLNFNSEDLVFHYGNGKQARVHMSHAGEFIQYVRVYDLPQEVPDNELAKVLAKYGKVKRVIREKFPAELRFDAYNGIRGVYIDVKMEIPTSLHFSNRRGNIYYSGNKTKCYLCKMDGYLKNSCLKRKIRKASQQQKDREESSTSGTYAGVVTDEASSGSNVLEEEEEVLEEELLEENMDMEVTPPPGTEASTGEQASENEGQKTKPECRMEANPIYRMVKELVQKNKESEAEKQKQERKKLAARPKKDSVSPQRKNKF